MSKIEPVSEEMLDLAKRAERAVRNRPEISAEEWAERMSPQMVREGVAIDRALRHAANLSEGEGDE